MSPSLTRLTTDPSVAFFGHFGASLSSSSKRATRTLEMPDAALTLLQACCSKPAALATTRGNVAGKWGNEVCLVSAAGKNARRLHHSRPPLQCSVQLVFMIIKLTVRFCLAHLLTFGPIPVIV